jgi:hypothetical protein
MCRVLVSLLLFSLLACSIAIDQSDDQTYAQFDARLRGMAGANERQLLGAMGRIPDTSYQVGDDQTKVLQWWWDTPSCSPRRAIGGYSPSPVRESFCIVEWTVSKGISQTYSWEGYGCGSVTLVNTSAALGSRATPVLPGRDAF